MLTSACQLLIVVCVSCVAGHQRIGLPSDTLHVADENKNEHKMFTIKANPLSMLKSGIESFHHHFARSKRSAHGSPRSVTANLNGDHHTTLIVHWAGEGSDVIIALAKNSSELDRSDLYVSYNYGNNFTDVNPRMTVESTNVQAVINKYYTVNKLNTHYLFTDLHSRCLFTTDDSCITFTRHCGLPFKPRSISVHPHNAAYMLGLDEESFLKQLYLSNDFGSTWFPVLSNVKAFYWDFPGSNDTSRIYAQEEQYGGKGQILSISLASFARSRQADGKDRLLSMDVMLRDVVDFQVKGDYIFATRSVNLLGSHNKGPTMQLWISHKGDSFEKAEFPNWHNVTDVFVADASEGQLMVCVAHNATYTNLYISDVNSYKFSLSLERVVYYNPKKSASNNWIKSYTKKPFADVTKISGVGGIYVASQQVGNTLSLNEQVSLISYDKGGEWQRIAPPALAINGQPSQCKGDCSLHLTQMFHQLHPASKFAPILSQNSAPGLVVASGILGSNLVGDPDVFVSTSAGIKWKIALSGPYLYATADQGGIIAAIHLQRTTKELLYSIDDGETWESYSFTDTNMQVYGLLTEPGENTTVFTVFGSPVSHHSWTIIQVDMKDVFDGKKCQDSDYKMWSVQDELPSKDGCLLGRITQYQRRDATAKCYNGRDFVRESVESNCLCTREDFECDYGYKEKKYSPAVNICERDTNVPYRQIHVIPDPCPPGTYYQYTRGYRKVPGDSCEGGQDHSLSPLHYACPIKKRPEFLLLTSPDSISRLDLGSGTTTHLLGMSYPMTVAAVFDWEKNALIFVDSDQSVKLMSLEMSNMEREILLEKDTTYSTVMSMAFDWTGRNLYVVRSDSTNIRSVIDVVNVDHRFERRIYSNFPDVRKLVLDPHEGFMYFVGKDRATAHYHLFRASMDGADEYQTHLFNSLFVGAGTVLTFDQESGQIFWVDPLAKSLDSAMVTGARKTAGASLNLEVQTKSNGGDTLAEPTGIATFKDMVYVVFKHSDMVMTASKSNTHDWIVFSTLGAVGVSGMVEVSNTSHHAMSACSPYHFPCSQLCLPRPSVNGTGGHNRVCLCGKGYMVTKKSESAVDEMCSCTPPEVMNQDGLCTVSNTSSCAGDRFTCHSGKCVPQSYQCDGEDDCGDSSDEFDCEYQACRKGFFTCHSGRCIMGSWQCDGADDCRDGLQSDELGCETHECKDNEFKCANHYCIRAAWRCDGDDDCHDNSDEENCTSSQDTTCSPWQFPCGDGNCVGAFLRCNNFADCPDGSDETHCNVTTCSEFQFDCGDQNNTCILKTQRCDGKSDCPDGEDENGCHGTSTVRPSPQSCSGFDCSNGVCVGWETICNGVDDCGNKADEVGCDVPSTTPAPTSNVPIDCPPYQFSCKTQHRGYACLHETNRCNGIVDCEDGMDESECGHTCLADQFDCETNDTDSCVWRSWVCDGSPDCANGKDEEGCQEHVECTSDEWRCVKDGSCEPQSARCNGKLDCDDASDELGCPNITCSIFDKNLEGCCNEEKCGVYLHKWVHWFWFIDRQRGVCKPVEEAAANIDHNLCGGTKVPVTCSTDQVACYSKRSCLSFTQICNRHNDCGNIDEDGCDCDIDSEQTPVFSEPTDRSVTWILDENVFSNFSYADVIKGVRLANLTWLRHEAGSGKLVTVTGLKPAQEYSFVFNYKGRRCVTEPVTVRTGDGLPSAPWDVSAKVKHEYMIRGNNSFALAVDVSWKAPKSPRGTIKFYVIYHQQIHNDGTAASDIFERTIAAYDVHGTSNLIFSDIIVEHIKHGKPYHFWVAAATKAGLGKESDKITVNISPGPDKSLRPTIKVLNNTTLYLKWHERPQVKGYKISVKVKDPLRSEMDTHAVPDVILSAPADHYKIKDLCPGSQIVYVTLAARYGNMMAYESHPEDTIFSNMGGTLPQVSITDVQLSGPTSFLLTYNVTQGTVANDKYLIYYTPDMSETPKSVTVFKDLSYKLKHVLACERYYVWVRPAYRSCPASRVKIITTQEDRTAPPKNVRAEVVLHSDYYNVVLTWEPSCGHHEKSMSYIITITKGGGKEGSFLQTSTTFTFKADPGVTYTLTVRAKVWNSRQCDPVTVTVPSLDGPINLIMEPESEHKAFVRWDWPPRWDTPDFKEYVLHTTGPGGVTLTNHTASSEIFLYLAQDGQYTFSVEVKDKKGKIIAETRRPALYTYESHIQVPQPQPPSSSMSRTHLIAIIVPVTLCVVALSAALVFFIVRHKRLQRSFLAFANSHYNIQSGTTTFSDDLDGDEPLIQGFSDDEPLVIA